MSDSLWPHRLQHTRPPCPSPTPIIYSNSCPWSLWCHPTISSSVIPFSSCLQSLPASGSFQMSQFLPTGGQSTGVSALATVLPMNIQDWFPVPLTGWYPCSPRDSLESSPTSQFKTIISSALSLLSWPYIALTDSFPHLEPVCSSMFSSNCCFLTCIQISQEVGKVVWYSHLFQNFPQFVVMQTVKGFGIVNKGEVDVFLELSCFLDDPTNVGNLISGSSALSKSSLYMWKFLVHILLKPSLENFEHYLISVWDECNCAVVWAFFGIGMKTDLFQSCGHCWVFPICWHIECSTFTASSFRIWKSSTGIPSPPLALFTVKLPKAHLTSHSRMYGSK